MKQTGRGRRLNGEGRASLIGGLMRHTPAVLTLVPGLYAGCAGQSSQTVPMALVPCAVPGIGTPDSVWHQVRASGFTFCVPPGWQPSGHCHDSIDANRCTETAAR